MIQPIYTLGYIEEEARTTLNDEEASDRKKHIAYLMGVLVKEMQTLIEEYEAN